MGIRWVGNQSLAGVGVQFPPANSKAVNRFQNTTGYPLTIDSFAGTWQTNYVSAKVKAVIYSDNSNAPDALLGTSDEKVGISTGVNWLTFSTPVTIANNSYFWVGVISDTLMMGANCTSSGTIKYNADTYSDGPTGTFGASSSSSYTFSMWVQGSDGQLTLGRLSVDAGSGVYYAADDHYDKFTLAAASVSVDAIHVYVSTTNAGIKGKAGIFNDNAGAPGTKVAQTQEVTGVASGTWITYTFASPVTLTAGTYWLGVIYDTDVNCPTIPYGGFLKHRSNRTYASMFIDNPPTTITNAPMGIDIYASYSLPQLVTGAVYPGMAYRPPMWGTFQ